MALLAGYLGPDGAACVVVVGLGPRDLADARRLAGVYMRGVTAGPFVGPAPAGALVGWLRRSTPEAARACGPLHPGPQGLDGLVTPSIQSHSETWSQ